ncbi:hypothetical protein MTO96_025599 [Rhipicephalus appendiculatus]
MRPLETANQALTGPGQVPIDTAGYFRATVEWRNARLQEKVFVIERLREALLSRSAVESLGIVQRPLERAETQECDIPDILAQYPKLTSGLGLMETTYRIKVTSDAKPYAFSYPRRVPIPLLPLVEAELKRMEDIGIIQKVEHVTEWCFPMVMAKKRNMN